MLVTHRAQVDGELSHPSVTSQNLDVQIVDLIPRHGCIESVFENLAARRRDQILKRFPEQLPLLITHVIPTPVAIAHQAGGINHQDQALGIVENLAGEVAFTLQFRLKRLETGYIEHQTAVLQNPILRVTDREGVD